MDTNKEVLKSFAMNIFPWADSLPQDDFVLFVEELDTVIKACIESKNYSSLSDMLIAWQSTAEVWEDEELVQSLLEPVEWM